MKFIIIFFSIFLSLIITVIYSIEFKEDDSFYPETYTFGRSKLLSEEQLNAASRSNVLFIGDRLSYNLYKNSDYMLKYMSKLLKVPESKVEIYNISSNYEGIHRTLKKIKELSEKKLPKIIIYHGASEEYVEPKFLMSELDSIEYNFKVYDDRYKRLVLDFFSISKSILYKKVKLKKFERNFDNKTYTTSDNISSQELSTYYELFKTDLQKIINIVKKNNSNIILLTSPINLMVRPKQSCSGSNFSKGKNLKNIMIKNILSGNDKVALENIENMIKENPGNAESYFVAGVLLWKVRRYENSKFYLNMATSLDCKRWRNTEIHNQIIRKLSNTNDITLIDFSELTNSYFDPKNIFKNELMVDAVMSKNILKLISHIIVRDIYKAR